MNPPTISDPEVQALAAMAGTMQVDYESDDVAWRGSPFNWIRARPSRQKGTIGENLVAGYVASKGFNVARSPDSQADRVIEGKRAEIKFSMLWASGTYTFQQLRDQRYEIAICLGISPFDAHLWVVEKAEIMRRWELSDGVVSQHGGNEGTDTAWLTVDPTAPHSWLRPYGGTLAAGVRVLSGLTGFSGQARR